MKIRLFKSVVVIRKSDILEYTQPEPIIVKEGFFSITFLRTNDTLNDTLNLNSQRQKEIIQLIKEDRKITADEIAKKLNTGIATIKREIAFLRKVQLIDRRGSKKTGEWVILFNFNDERRERAKTRRRESTKGTL